MRPATSVPAAITRIAPKAATRYLPRDDRAATIGRVLALASLTNDTSSGASRNRKSELYSVPYKGNEYDCLFLQLWIRWELRSGSSAGSAPFHARSDARQSVLP